MGENKVKEKIGAIRAEAEGLLGSAETTADVEQARVQFLGKKGSIQALMPLLKDASPEERPQIGALINELKQFVTSLCESTHERLLLDEEEARLSTETLDVTLPGRDRFLGRSHLMMQVLDRVTGVLSDMGFSIQVGPDIETDYYNFEALNFPKDHPARDMQDTFWIDETHLLRTQMSDLQVRTMEKSEPPIRVMAPGKCYRNEEVTGRSHVFFHQVDVFYVDKGVTFADLMATKEEFLTRLFSDYKVKWRHRPSYFPFVEPGMETDISCLVCQGEGCHVCKHSGWLEVSGSGMIHPEVLKNGGIDPEEYSGFAWGMGLERMTMLMHKIGDIRLFTENDMRFLRQFS